MPIEVIENFTNAARNEKVLCTDAMLESIIKLTHHHVIWSNTGWVDGLPRYRVTTFPKIFTASAIEVWWPLIRPQETPVLTLLPDGSWQDHSAESDMEATWTGFSDSRGVRLVRGKLLRRA